MKHNLYSIKSKFRIFFIFSLLTLALSCEKDKVIIPPEEVIDICDGTSYTYSVDIKPIMDTNCATSSCHAGNNSLPSYATYTGVYDDRSRIKRGINLGLSNITGGRAELSKAEEDIILCWIKNDAPE